MPPQQIPPFTVKQGQYLAFIYYYSNLTFAVDRRLNQTFDGFFE